MNPGLQDPRVAPRHRAARRSLTLAALLALTLGFGGLAVTFSVADAVRHRGLPYPDSGHLVRLGGTFAGPKGIQPWPLSQMDFGDWRRENTVFSSMSVFGTAGFNVEQGRGSQRVWGELVNDSYFALLGQKASLGRFFRPDEDAKLLDKFVVVLGYDLWQRSFGADPRVVGSELHLNNKVYTIVGVAPRGFRGLSDQASLWVPSMLPPISEYVTIRRERWVHGVARLRPGVSIAQAQAQMNRITAAEARAYSDMNRGIGVAITPLKEEWVSGLRPPLLPLELAAGVLLIIAGVNAARLLRAAGGAETAGRRPRWGESVLPALAGAVLGLAAAAWAAPRLVDASGFQLPSFLPATPGPAVVAAILALAVVCGLAMGLTRRTAEGRGGRAGRWLARAFVLAQVALALVLAGRAAILARDYHRYVSQDLGFRTADLLTYRMDMKGPQYMDNLAVAKLLREQYIPRVARVPGVAQMSMANPTLPTDRLVGGYMTIDDHDSDSPDGTYIGLWHSVSPGYFEMIGIPILRGRSFNMKDTGTNSIIVSKLLADQQWPGKDPIGRRIKLDARNAPEPWQTVIGVAGEVRHQGYEPERAPGHDVYVSLIQFPFRLPLTINFLIRPQPGVERGALLTALHRAMMDIRPELPDYDPATLRERLDERARQPRFEVLLANLLAALAVAYAALGICADRTQRAAASLTEPLPRLTGQAAVRP
jgi:putative ABC transport system permease protein